MTRGDSGRPEPLLRGYDLPVKRTELTEVVQSGDDQEGAVVPSGRSTVDTREEFEAFEMREGVFDRGAVAVVDLVGPFLDEVERVITPSFVRHLETSLGIVWLNTVVTSVEANRQVSGEFA